MATATLHGVDLTDVELVKSVWAAAFRAAEATLIEDLGFTCDDLAPHGKECIACRVSIELRKALLGEEYGPPEPIVAQVRLGHDDVRRAEERRDSEAA